MVTWERRLGGRETWGLGERETGGAETRRGSSGVEGLAV